MPRCCVHQPCAAVSSDVVTPQHKGAHTLIQGVGVVAALQVTSLEGGQHLAAAVPVFVHHSTQHTAHTTHSTAHSIQHSTAQGTDAEVQQAYSDECERGKAQTRACTHAGRQAGRRGSPKQPKSPKFLRPEGDTQQSIKAPTPGTHPNTCPQDTDACLLAFDTPTLKTQRCSKHQVKSVREEKCRQERAHMHA